MNFNATAKNLIKGMSRKEKIGQITQLSYSGQSIEEMKTIIKEITPGSLILCGSALGGSETQRRVCLEHINELQRTAVEETSKKIPLLFGRDVIHGHHVAFPVPLTMTASFDFDLIRECYDAIRDEAINDGVRWTFAPMLDMSREPRWGRIVEGTGEDPYLGECFARAAIKGFQTENVSDERSILACAKHFIGYGASEGGRDYNHTEISDYALQNYYLPAFRAAVDSGVATIMVSFNDLNGIPVSGNKKVISEILRQQLKFQGFVVSDWDAIRQMTAFSGYCENEKAAAKAAMEAGIDMDMMSSCYFNYISDLIDDGELSEELLDAAVLRVIETKLKFGIFENPYIKYRGYDISKHLQLSQRLAEESIVLLKNNNVLPLKANSNIGLCGEFARDNKNFVGTWSLDYNPDFSKTIYEAMQKKNKTDFIESGNFYKSAAVFSSDVIVVVLGEMRAVTGEAAALADIGISAEQLSLVKRLKCTGKPIVGVLCFARPVVLGEIDGLFDALLYAGHGGSRTSEAIISILLGETEPEGRLPFTLPYHQGQLPLYYNALPGARKINGYYNDYNPYHMNYCDCPGNPAYPFGFGLSYTEFVFSDIACEQTEMALEAIQAGGSIKFSISVKNTGNRNGIAVVQLYVQDLFGSRIRPLRSLRNFCKVRLNPGEERNVNFRVSSKDLGFYLENGVFVIEKGSFNIYIGENCLTEHFVQINLV